VHKNSSECRVSLLNDNKMNMRSFLLDGFDSHLFSFCHRLVRTTSIIVEMDLDVRRKQQKKKIDEFAGQFCHVCCTVVLNHHRISTSTMSYSSNLPSVVDKYAQEIDY
jgi:hypothetical protein